MYDAIVVGARCAGAPTAMLLARKGYNVLVVDRATFPSDTLSTHLLWPHGAEILDRWGLLSPLAATGLPPICRRMTFDVGPVALVGTVPDANSGRGGFCPRRTVLDSLLVNAAVDSGAEMREGFKVEELLLEGDAVVGIRGRTKGGKPVEERARIVIGADGIHSFVAKSVGAPEYDRRPIAVCAYWSYFSGVPQEDAELYVRDGCAFGAVPTNDGLHILMVNWPARDFPAVRADVEGHVRRALALAPEFAARLGRGTQEETWYGTAGVPGYFRKPYGNGWALVGDASYNRDPITAQGMSDAFIDAELIAEAIDSGLSGVDDLEPLLATHEAMRNERVRPMYEFTYQMAQLEPPPPPMQALFRAMHGNQAATNAFLSAITGSTPIGEFMSPENLDRIIGAGSSA
jgi:2-polyprenyl-6-methoxyphenol hydroxylase-like FAD-dependent oxidoreductase